MPVSLRRVRDEKSNRHFWYVVARLLSLTGLIVWLGSAYLWYAYAQTRPPIANPLNGSVYALNTHGSVVFLTRAEWISLNALMGAGFGCVIAGLAINIYVVKR